MITLNPDIFDIEENEICLKSYEPETPISELRIFVEIRKIVHKSEVKMSLSNIFDELPDFCKEEIGSHEDFLNLSKMYVLGYRTRQDSGRRLTFYPACPREEILQSL